MITKLRQIKKLKQESKKQKLIKELYCLRNCNESLVVDYQKWSLREIKKEIKLRRKIMRGAVHLW